MTYAKREDWERLKEATLDHLKGGEINSLIDATILKVIEEKLKEFPEKDDKTK